MALIYRNVSNPAVEVELLHDGELRIGEIRRQAVVYRRLSTGLIYIRPKAEFDRIFQRLEKK